MKVDDLYMDNLLEYVFDDKLFVTYKFISVKLKVHVNLAKQMLYHFYDTEKAKGKKICATYYLSGMAPQKWISSLNNSAADDNSNELEDGGRDSSHPADSFGDKDAYLVMLCKDFELEEMKQKFTRLYSVHVYGLSSSSVQTLDMLNKVLEEPLRDDDGNSPVHYGPISCKAAFEYREDPRLAPLLKSVQEVKASVELAKAKQESANVKVKSERNVSNNSVDVKSPVKSNKSERTTTTSKKPSATDSSNSEDKGRLKNMFAAAATRPKPKPKPVEEVSKSTSAAISSESSKKPVSSSKQGNSKKKPSKEKEVTRKRKRIRDVFSSSDEEEESKISDEEDGMPESPIPRKRQQIESDSDEDFKPEVKKAPSPPPVQSASGKRRVSKTIQKRHVDEQGFLVTVMTQVMVSESDQSDEESKPEAKSDQKSTNKEKETSLEQNQNGPAAGAKKEVTNKKVPVGNPPKKQATLMSFFQKK